MANCWFSTTPTYVGAIKAMYPISYYTMTRQSKDPKYIRLEMVRYARENSVKPSEHTWQADVETAHSLIEDEFYVVEDFTSRKDFLEKATTYNLWFNIARKNSYKGHKTPWDIIRERNHDTKPNVVALPPAFLDELFMKKLDQKPKGGYDVIERPSLFQMLFLDFIINFV